MAIKIISTPMDLVLCCEYLNSNSYILAIEDLEKFSRVDLNFHHYNLDLIEQISAALNISFKKTTISQISNQIRNLRSDVIFANTGIWPIIYENIKEIDWKKYKKFGLNYGADFLMNFEKSFVRTVNRKYAREVQLWQRGIASLNLNCILFPSFLSKPQISHAANLPKIKFVNHEKMKNLIKKISAKTSISNVLDSYKHTDLVLSFYLKFSKKDFRKIVSPFIGNRKIIKVLPKLHPNAKNDSYILKLIQESMRNFDVTFISNDEIFKGKYLPLEFIFVDNPEISFVGNPTSALVFLPKNQAEIIFTSQFKRRKTDKRSYRNFLSLYNTYGS